MKAQSRCDIAFRGILVLVPRLAMAYKQKRDNELALHNFSYHFFQASDTENCSNLFNIKVMEVLFVKAG